MSKSDGGIVSFVSDKMTIELDVFGAFMEGGIVYNVNCGLVVTEKKRRCLWNMKIKEKISNPSYFACGGS